MKLKNGPQEPDLLEIGTILILQGTFSRFRVT